MSGMFLLRHSVLALYPWSYSRLKTGVWLRANEQEIGDRPLSSGRSLRFYARKHLLFLARLSHRNSVSLSVTRVDRLPGRH